MKIARKIFFSIVITALLLTSAYSQTFNWAKSMGGTSDDWGYSIATDASGNVYTTGYFQGTVDFDPGEGIFNLNAIGCLDIFISKLDASGNFVYAKSIGGTSGGSYGTSISLDASDNVYITGGFHGTVDFDPGAGTFNLTSSGGSDIFILKLGSSGNFVYAKSLGGTGDDVGNSIVTDVLGNVYTTGSFQETTDFDPGVGTFNLTSAGGNDIFISKLDSTGNFIYAKSMGGTDNYDIGYSIAIDTFNNVYTTGSFRTTADFDPGVGTFNLTSMGGWEIFILKLNSSGNFIWAKQMGGTWYDESYSISLDASCNVYTTGYFQSTADFDPGVGTFNLTSTGYRDIFISKLDSSGNFIWAKRMGGTSDDYGYSIALDVYGNVYFTGLFSGIADFDPGSGTFNLTSVGYSDIFISKLDASGNFVYAKSLGGISFDEGRSITLDASGNIYTTGYYNGTADFDPGIGTYNLTSAGGADFFVCKLGQTTGIIENELLNVIMVYPNPAQGYINLKANSNEFTIEILDIVGQVLIREKSKKTIDIQTLPAGTYFVKVKTGESEYQQKIIVY